MNKRTKLLSNCLALWGTVGCFAQSSVLYQDRFDGDTLSVNTSGVGGGAVNRTIEGHSWEDDGNLSFIEAGTPYTQRALVYSQNAFQSDSGFRLTVELTTGSIGDLAAHNLSFGLVSVDTDLSSYSGYNPFQADSSVYSLGANVTLDGGAAFQGLNFTDGSTVENLDQSGTRVQFKAGEPCKVYIEIGIGGSWNYRIDDQYEASGVLLDGFDFSKSYRVVVYGQDDHGGGKSIQSVKLEKAPAAGERAAKLRGTWTSGVDASLIDSRLKALKTLDAFQVRLSEGASLSAQHFAPHKLLESLVGGSEVVPPWGNPSLDEPENDPIMDQILDIKSAGFKVKVYLNSENFVGSNQSQFDQFVASWMAYCDTDPEVQAFIASQPYHTGIWDAGVGGYVNAETQYPYRKYMFCYAEYVLKEFALRYGPYVDSWIFDDGGTMEENGDVATSGLIEEQRIYQAFADAVHAGNPDIPTSFNNGRSTINYASYPFAHAIRFEDFTFGHAFGGNKNHAEKVSGNQFNLNYQHITRMAATNGFVHDGGNWSWDDLVVGNFHSKLSTTSWKYGATQAWEQNDFNQWNLEAMQAGGSMTWDGSYNRSVTAIYEWAYVMLENLDAYLMEHESPGAPNWARAYTVLPDAARGVAYSRLLVQGEDFWDPEGDSVSLSLSGAPSWLSVSEVSPGTWELSGVPTELLPTRYEFELRATDASGTGVRVVELTVSDTVGKQGLLAHWTLDEGSGASVSDASGNGHEGTVSGAAWVAGLDGNALEFDGAAATVSLPATAFSNVSDEVSVAMWAKGDLTNPQANSVLYAQSASGSRLLNIHLPWSNSRVYWDAGDQSGYDRIDKVATPSEYEGEWHHWVFAKNANTGEMSIYLDGSLWHSGSGHTTPIGAIDSVTLGSNHSANSYDGIIDDVQLYDVALTAAEVEDLYLAFAETNAYGYFTDLDDIGAPGLSGTATFSNGSYLVEGGGADIWGSSDSFSFVSADATGDIAIVARVVDVENTHNWAKAGVMIRESLAANSPNVAVVVRPNRQLTLQWRNATGGTSSNVGIVGDTSSVKWIRLIRSGNLFTGYYSTDGSSWTQIAAQSVAMSSNAKVGLAVTSHDDGALCTASFDNVSLD
ncbi:LamG-like jellyroll fold domain-containing protein [Pelagicoccus sp. SDUM812005]|uniref:LamG-like jellyroll fold domain-containing protein n=1 Tax=Pelagicoccus sp. SDUM812005 TaxID=3041257 RepID=UPI0028101015|nr:LamG-like jellyroll fold domain-containing protein [Pelagicoccus sp. SDUM812005]MDQ8179584.1 putative Ig domain-containing protein [Pelagicoccus sp. SDUM812005]